ncbi:MAG: TIGR02147 family protein [Bdellovibrionia bacterium]
MQIPDYRELMRGELIKRSNFHPRFSLRSFARFLALEPGHLSRVLKGQRNISSGKARLIAEKLFNTHEERDYFVGLVDYQLAKKPMLKEIALRRLTDTQVPPLEANLSLDSFRFIADWYHFPILDLTSVEGFDFKPVKIAKYLGISEREAAEAVERLLRLGLLKRQGRIYTRSQKVFSTPTDLPSEAIRRYHRQMIEKARSAVDEQTVHERYLRAKTLSFNRRDLDKYKKLVEEFMSKASRLATTSRSKDSVYQINVQIFDFKARTNQ